MKLLFTTLLAFIFAPIFSQSIDTVPYQNDPLYVFIQNWWKTPYKYGGISKVGIDCSAFTGKLIHNVYDINLPRTAKEQYMVTERISKTDLKDGDLVFFRTKVKSGWHVGVYMTDGYFIHSKSRIGVSINNLEEANYKRIYYGAGRLKKQKNT